MLKRINQNPPYGTNYPLNGVFWLSGMLFYQKQHLENNRNFMQKAISF